jgi:hypothetical protein
VFGDWQVAGYLFWEALSDTCPELEFPSDSRRRSPIAACPENMTSEMSKSGAIKAAAARASGIRESIG